jgi:drug/metabolite transporter (DMT)-like permease
MNGITRRTAAATMVAMLAFAGNSLLCRMALRNSAIDPASFTAIRLGSGALVLLAIQMLRGGGSLRQGSWASGFALFAYAAAFSWAYVSLAAGTGALLLFGAVQATMLSWGLLRGERMDPLQWSGLVIAATGLIALLMPGLSAPSPVGAALMIVAGIAWGVYSLRAKGAGDPTAVTAANFARATPWAIALWLVMPGPALLDPSGIGLAVLSGTLASGAGYAIWYLALRGLSATTAASVQLSVPVIAALGGVLLLGEPLGWRLLLCASAVIGGIALVIVRSNRQRT